MPPDTGTTYRNRIGNGSITPDHSLVRMPSDGSTYAGRKPAGGISQLRSFWPILLLALLAVVLLLNTGSFMHSSAAATPEHLTQTIQQLSQNQAAMMQMLQTLSTNSSAAGSKQEPGEKAADSPELPAAFAAIPALTKLHNELLRSSHSYEQHRTVMLQTLERLVHLEPAAAQADIEQQLQEPGDLMQLFTCRLYKLLLSTGKLIPCREDSTLVVEDPAMGAGTAGSQHSSSHHLSHLHLWGHNKDQPSSSTSTSSTSSTAKVTKYYFATNLRDNSVNMPQYILSLLQTLLRLPVGSVFVSAYESNSDDGAHGWVDVLQLALNVIGTPSRLITRGMLVRLEGSNRIQHLARVRNMALAPLYQHYAAARDKATNSNSSSSSSSGSSGTRRLQAEELLLADEAGFRSSSSGLSLLQQELSGSNSGSSSRLLQTTAQLEAVAAVDDAANLPPGVLPWDPDWIVFVNDAFFCWGMVIRLMNYKADITCGMDFWQNPGEY